jgi:hypothetical protein
MAGTKRQKDKKNHTRPKAGDIGYTSSMHRPRKKKKENLNQLSLLT